MHGPTVRRRRKATDYRRRLEEKQKLRFNYGITEAQLRRYFRQAARRAGLSGAITGEVLLSLLERRLDNVVFRLGFARTIPAARQLVTHGHVRVNGAKVDRPGYELQPGDTVTVSDGGRRNPHVRESVEAGPRVMLPSYLELDPGDPYEGRLVGLPSRSDVPVLVNEAAVVEFYAR